MCPCDCGAVLLNSSLIFVKAVKVCDLSTFKSTTLDCYRFQIHWQLFSPRIWRMKFVSKCCKQYANFLYFNIKLNFTIGTSVYKTYSCTWNNSIPTKLGVLAKCTKFQLFAMNKSNKNRFWHQLSAALLRNLSPFLMSNDFHLTNILGLICYNHLLPIL